MNNSHDKLTTRLTQILLKLNSSERFTIDELATEFNVSLRTIQRDINERLSYLPLKKENNYIFLEEYYLGKLSFQDIKNFASLSGIKELYQNLDDDFVISLLNQKFKDIYLIKGTNYETTNLTKEFKDIEIAIKNHYQINFTYNDKKRKFKPYRLVNTSGIWYLIGDDNDKLKTFTLSKLTNLQLTNQEFIINDEFINIIEEDKDTWFSQDNIEVILSIDASIASYFTRRELLPHQKIIEQNSDKLIISTVVSYDEEILKIVKSWIPNISIVKPVYLQEKLQDQLNGYIKTMI